MPRTAIRLASAAVLVSLGIVARAHPGGLGASGCHYEIDTGRYHCHRAVKANPNALAFARKSLESVCHGAASPNYTTLKHCIDFEARVACPKSGGRTFGS